VTKAAGGLLFLGYFVLKYLAYSFWCWMGLKMLRKEPPERAKALAFGALRVFLGFTLGLFIWAMSTKVAASVGTDRATAQIAAYLGVYVPVRWFEWSLIASLVERSPLAFLVPRTRNSLLFRLGGIAVSCLADVPMLIDGLPIGRFMC
jgi:hypothetical protein